MRSIILFAIFYVFMTSCVRENRNCILKGEFGNDTEGHVIISPYKGYKTKAEVVANTPKFRLKNGKFESAIDSTIVLRQGKAEINNKIYRFLLFTEPGEISIKLNENDELVINSRLNKEYQKLSRKLRFSEYVDLKYEYTKTQEQIDFVESFKAGLWAELAINSKSIPLSAIFNYVFSEPDLETLENIVNGFSSEIHNTYYLTNFIRLRDIERNCAVGVNSPMFTLKSDKGEKISLNDFKGKYLLIDFWASWCGPCREFIPEMKKIHAAFNKDGLEILNISVDRNQEHWLKALKEENMTWNQVLDSNDTAKKYNIHVIPSLILISKDGKILAKNIHGKAIWDELAKQGFVK